MTTATANPSTLDFDCSDLFTDDAQPPEGVQKGGEAPDDPQTDIDTEITTLAEEEDDGPQPGDEIDEPEPEGVQVSDAAPPAGITSAENALVEIWNAERRCGIAKSRWNAAKDAAKEAKDEYDGCVDELRRLAREAECDRDRPLLAMAEAAPAVQVDEQAEPSEAATDAPAEKLQPGQIRIVLLKEIVDEHPQRGTLTWPKGAELVARVDNSGGVIIPFADDPTDGTGLEAEEFDVLEDLNSPCSVAAGDHADDPRLDTPLAETPIPSSLLAKLTDHGIRTVRELANFTSINPLTQIKGIGATKAEKIEAAMVEFWKAATP